MNVMLQSSCTMVGRVSSTLPWLCRAASSNASSTAASAMSSISADADVTEPKSRSRQSTGPPSTPEATLSIDEVLYLAEQGGITLPREVQLQILRRPSAQDYPFLAENPFVTPPPHSNIPSELAEGLRLSFGMHPDEAFKQLNPEVVCPTPSAEEHQPPKDFDPMTRSFADWGVSIRTQEASSAEDIDATQMMKLKMLRATHPEKRLHILAGRQWVLPSEGVGRNRSCTAIARLSRGLGKIRVNGTRSIEALFPFFYHRVDIVQPLFLVGVCGLVDVDVRCKGGGLSGKSLGIRSAVAKALLEANPACAEQLQETFSLTEDRRSEMPKMMGRKGARAQGSWSKR